MDKKKLYTLGLKFKRYNIEFEHDEDSNSVVFGGVQGNTKYIAKNLALIAAGVAFMIFILGFMGLNRAANKLLLIVPAGIIVYAFF